MGWVILGAVAVVALAGWAWSDLIDKAENIDPDEPYDFWMTDED